MKINLSQGKRIFIVAAAISVVALCVLSFYFSCREVEESALASPSPVKNIVIKIVAGSYKVGDNFSLSWTSDCRGGNVMVWLSAASSSKKNLDILVPLSKFSAADFGASDADGKTFFSDIWKINSSASANSGKFSAVIPDNVYLDGSVFKNNAGIYYIYSLPDGRIALQKMVKDQPRMPVLPGTYYFRVDIKGKNGCTGVGFSQPINIINK